MKLLGVSYGGLEHVKMSKVQNVATMIQLEKQLRAGISADDAAMNTASVRYAETTLTQSGHRIIPGSARVVMRESRGPVGEMMNYQIEYGLITPEQATKVLTEEGVDPSFEVPDSFDILLDVKAIDADTSAAPRSDAEKALGALGEDDGKTGSD
jgi:hypothetical protein